MTANRCEAETDYAPSGAPFTGRKMLATILGFFGVIIAVNGVMVATAISDFPGLLTSNSYVASQHFERDVETLRAQPIRGWEIDGAFAAEAEGARLTLEIADGAGAPVMGLPLAAEFGRPTHSREDQRLLFVEIAPGRYRALTTVAPGDWRVTLVAPAASEGVPAQRRSLRFFAPRAAGLTGAVEADLAPGEPS